MSTQAPADCPTAHDIYKTGDTDAPEAILDRNNEVVLSLCRVCGRAEAELVDALAQHIRVIDGNNRMGAGELAERIVAWLEGGRILHKDSLPEIICDLIEGMTVSVDVSTGEDDAGHRLLGTVTEVMQHAGGKHGVVLLVQNPAPNFDCQSPAAGADQKG